MTARTWDIDVSHSSIQFTARHMMITKVRGAFRTFSGKLQLEEGAMSLSTVDVTIAAPSIDTGEPKRDEHLKSRDFLNVEEFPTLTFKSRSIIETRDGYEMKGDLTMHGVTREVTLDVQFEGMRTDPWGVERIAFAAKAQIDRDDFGLTWNQVLEAGGVLVSNRVVIEVEVQAVRTQAAAA